MKQHLSSNLTTCSTTAVTVLSNITTTQTQADLSTIVTTPQTTTTTANMNAYLGVGGQGFQSAGFYNTPTGQSTYGVMSGYPVTDCKLKYM